MKYIRVNDIKVSLIAVGRIKIVVIMFIAIIIQMWLAGPSLD